MTERNGDWMCTATGRRFWPFDPRPEDVFLEDIAAALSKLCRFGGHCREFYSVAQHSVLVSWHSAHDRAHGLLHDAAEAYLVDLPRPVKREPRMWVYRDAEAAIWKAVAKRFGLDPSIPVGVEWADEALLATEARDLMNTSAHPWRLETPPLEERIRPWGPTEAYTRFLGEAERLGLPGLT